MARLAYLQRSLTAQLVGSRFACPNCGNRAADVVARKYIITQLRRCKSCKMLFRTPTDDPDANAAFYENEYEQGFTTKMPSPEALAELKRTNFVGTEKDYAYYIGVLTGLGLMPGAKLFDYGCSWGYGSYQLANAGFDVTAFEIAASRGRYASERLGVAVVADMDEVARRRAGEFDCFFSAHVLEHLPAPRKAFAHAMKLLRSDGLFVSFTPNGSQAFRGAATAAWRQLWGEVHPNCIDDVFLDHNFTRSPRCLGSSPVASASLPAKPELRLLNALDQVELFFAARRNGNAWS